MGIGRAGAHPSGRGQGVRSGSSGRRPDATPPWLTTARGSGGGRPAIGFPPQGPSERLPHPRAPSPRCVPAEPWGLMGRRGSLPAAGGWEMGASFPARASTGSGGRGLILPVPREGGHRGVSGAGRGCGSVSPTAPVGESPLFVAGGRQVPAQPAHAADSAFGAAADALSVGQAGKPK